MASLPQRKPHRGHWGSREVPSEMGGEQAS